MSGLEGGGLTGGGVGGSYQPGVYVPLKALFLVTTCFSALLHVHKRKNANQAMKAHYTLYYAKYNSQNRMLICFCILTCLKKKKKKKKKKNINKQTCDSTF